MEQRAHKICDGCGRDMAKASILYDGKAYCLRCFKKHFWGVPCDTCGNLTSAFHGQQPVTCKACRSKGRTCIDCGVLIVNKGEQGRKIGLKLPDGVVCSVCRDHYREKRPCAACGRPARYLSRDIKAGFTEPVCSSCRHQSRNYVHCSQCGSYRYEFGEIDGKKVCFSCYRLHNPTSCPGCGKAGIFPAREMCAECTWKAFVRTKVKETTAGFSHEWCKGLFGDFCEELITRYGGYDAKEKLPFYVPFFVDIDRAFPNQDDVTVAALFRLFKDGALRKYYVPYIFLESKGLISDGRKSLVNEFQALKQQSIVVAAEGQWYGPTLKDFLEHLLKVRERYQKRGWKGKYERFKMLSITNSLEAAELFLRTADVHDTRQLTPENLDAFFFNHEAYKFQLFAFVRFLRKRGRTFLKLDMRGLPKPTTIKSMSDKAFETLIIQLLNVGDKDIKEALVLLFMSVYSQRPKSLATLRLDDIFVNQHGYRIVFSCDEVEIDPAVGDILGRYLEIRSNHRDEKNEYLFPGRMPGSHISAETLKEYPEKFGVTGKELFVTSLTRLSKFKLRYPNALTKSLGISLYAAIKYLSIFNKEIKSH